jgi:hypothetical protein
MTAFSVEASAAHVAFHHTQQQRLRAIRSHIEDILAGRGRPWPWNRHAGLCLDMLVLLEEGETWHAR